MDLLLDENREYADRLHRDGVPAIWKTFLARSTLSTWWPPRQRCPAGSSTVNALRFAGRSIAAVRHSGR
jgi:hypothetical protein